MGVFYFFSLFIHVLVNFIIYPQGCLLPPNISYVMLGILFYFQWVSPREKNVAVKSVARHIFSWCISFSFCWIMLMGPQCLQQGEVGAGLNGLGRPFSG